MDQEDQKAVWDEFWTDQPLCPYCNKEIADPWDYRLKDDDTTTFKCGWCNNPIEMSCNITVEYSTRKDEQICFLAINQ